MNTFPVLPDLLLLATGVAVLVADARARDEDGKICGRLAAIGTVCVLAALLFTRSSVSGGWSTYAVTPQGFWWRLIFTLALFFTQILSAGYFDNGPDSVGARHAVPPQSPGAFHALLLFCVLGMFVLVSARELLTFFLGLELATLPLFALAGFQSRSGESVEAASKLMVMAGMATALNLFGLSLLYGAAGNLSFDGLALAASRPSRLLELGALLLFGGIGFKISLVPLQMWAPDVYEGAPTPVTAFLSVGSKAAGLAAMAALFFGPLDALRLGFYPVFAVAAVASMVAGNLGAMRQHNARRFMAYSSIAQAGYFLLAFTGDSARGQSALLFNLFVYGAATLAFFFALRATGPKRVEEMGAFRDLSREKPGAALLLLLSMFSLAGIPPLAGFLGKFQLFSVAMREKHYALVFIAVANSVLSLYYYLRPVKEAYVANPEFRPPLPRLGFAGSLPLWILALAVVLLGLWPGFPR